MKRLFPVCRVPGILVINTPAALSPLQTSVARGRFGSPGGVVLIAWGDNEYGKGDVPDPNADFIRVSIGNNRDRVVPGNYDRGRVDSALPAIFREESALWAVREFTRAYFGAPGDLPLARPPEALLYQFF